VVMLAYNIWRSFKMLANHGLLEQDTEGKAEGRCAPGEIMENTIRIARLKLLFIAAKITGHSNQDEVKYSQHDSRVSGLFRFMEYLDRRRKEIRPWLDRPKWLSNHLVAHDFSPAI